MNIPIKFCWNFGYERSFSMMSPKGGQKKKSTKSMAWNHNNFLIESLLNSRIPTAHLFCKCIILLQLLTHITKKKLLKLILFSQPKSFFVFVCQLKLTNGYNWIWWGRQARQIQLRAWQLPCEKLKLYVAESEWPQRINVMWGQMNVIVKRPTKQKRQLENWNLIFDFLIIFHCTCIHVLASFSISIKSTSS